MGAGWVDRDAAVVWHGFTQMAAFADNEPVIVESAEGRELIATDGRRYLDAISSLWVTTLGHRVPELDDAVRGQLGRVAHSTLLGNGNRVVIELAEALAAVVPVDRPHFLFASDGAAAVEQALKIAFQYWVNEGAPHRSHYLAFGDAYHGDTIGSLSLGDGGFGADLFDPLRFPVVRAPGFDDPACMDEAARIVRERAPKLAAVVVEPLVQAAAGMRVLPPRAFATLARACEATGVLLVCDEVATGFGRTGTLFASERCGLTPDLMCLGKGLSGGYLPMAATAANERVYRAFLDEDLGSRTLFHGHSYQGNALAAATALAHLRRLTESDVLANVRERSEELLLLLHERVKPQRAVSDVRLQGLMGCAEIAAGPRAARAVAAAATRRGVLLRSLGDCVIFVLPLTITGGEVGRMVRALEEALEDVANGLEDARGSSRARARTPAAVGSPDGPRAGDWPRWARGRLDAIEAAGRRRLVRDFDARGTTGGYDGGQPVVSFASNDYLGLASHAAVVAAARAALERWGAGAGAARLVVGSRPVHSALERALAEWRHADRALLFATGYAANLGVLAALGDRDTLICSDERNHASIIDGCRLARAEVAVYPHGDLHALERLLRGARRCLVVTESVFSMDGDIAPVRDIAEITQRHGALLVLDEAHAVLQEGPELAGATALRVGTLSKYLGSQGGFVTGPAALVDLLVNTARPFVFSTAPSPADAAAALAALQILRSSEGAALRRRLVSLIDRVAPGHPTPIVPVECGDERAALEASRDLLERGLLVPAIRPPTVPPGTSRLRVSLSAAHTEDQVERLAEALAALEPVRA